MERKYDGGLFDNRLIVEVDVSKIRWLRLLRCEDFALFFVIRESK